jgi:hypothetical protein
MERKRRLASCDIPTVSKFSNFVSVCKFNGGVVRPFVFVFCDVFCR